MAALSRDKKSRRLSSKSCRVSHKGRWASGQGPKTSGGQSSQPEEGGGREGRGRGEDFPIYSTASLAFGAEGSIYWIIIFKKTLTSYNTCAVPFSLQVDRICNQSTSANPLF